MIIQYVLYYSHSTRYNPILSRQSTNACLPYVHVQFSRPFLQTNTIYTSSSSLVLDPTLNTPILNQDRWPIQSPPTKSPVVNGRKNRDPPEHHHIPVHRLRIHPIRYREKAEDKEWNQENLCYEVDRQPVFTEGEFGSGKCFPAEAFRNEAADGEDVGGEEGGDCERHYGVQRDGRAKVDEGDDDAEPKGHPEGVERDVPAGFDLVDLA